jgi:hypothetical protein
MIYREKIFSALEKCAGEFALYEREVREQVAAYNLALDATARMSEDEIAVRLLTSTGPTGALPTPESFDTQSFVIPFSHEFPNRDAARQWAYEVLLNRTTFAADGSQIMPTKDFSIPIAAVQIGWFENPHTTDGKYTKEATFEVLSPEVVMVRTGGDVEASFQAVQQRRYTMEIEAIKNFMNVTAQKGFDLSHPPVVFFDNLLVISFVDILPENQRDAYIGDIVSLLKKSKETGIPVIGYIDTSMARDLVTMLRIIHPDLNESPKLQDAALFTDKMKWGDRTPLFRCARQGVLENYGEEWRREIGFVYLKTTGDAPPSRIDLPMWVYERGLLDEVMNIIRGEIIVGNGYPYVIEAADQTAVVSGHDREAFYAIFQDFSERNGFRLSRARKAVSKSQRR